MGTLWKHGWLAGVFVLAGASFAMAQPAKMPMPGSLNAVQGQVTIDGYPASAQSLRGEALQRGQSIRTRHGKAELLLTPGSFLRIGNDSQVRMLSRTLADTSVKIDHGRALLDAGAKYHHHLTVFLDGARARIDKRGLYGFNANRQTVAVLHGKATVYDGGSRVKLKGKRLLRITGQAPPQVTRLNVRAFKSTGLYRWSEARNRYEHSAARSVREAISRSGRWFGPGWYWSPYWGFYAYVASAGPYYFSPYYGPYYRPYAWNAWSPGWGPGWGWGWDDDDGDGDGH